MEIHAKRRVNRGGKESSRGLSRYFLAVGLLAPVLILGEIVWLGATLPVWAMAVFAAADLSLLVARVACIETLGPFYSVHVRIAPHHVLVRRGIYRRFRHPLYLIAILEAVSYPMACGAPLAAVLLFLLGAPATLLRRRKEERVLATRFGDEYVRYREETWF